MANKTILLSAGGTGGHLFPAEALAHELQRRGWTVHLATDARAERFSENFPASLTHAIPSATIAGRNPIKLVRAMFTIWRGVRQARALIASIKPAAVVGFGGYPTLPPVWAATRAKVPTLIHEQNAVMGRANRALASRVTAIAGGFLPEDDGAFSEKTVQTGNPVRPSVIAAAEKPYRPSGPGEPFRLLVFGGSQGAQFFSDAVPAAVALLPEALRGRLHVVQQARTEDGAKVRGTYAGLNVPADVSPFFDDMAARIAEAQLVISRSGASTVSEVAAIGRPALLVPYPYALDHDQAANAAALQRADAAEVRAQSTLDPEAIASLLAHWMEHPDELSAMAANARGEGRPDATRLLADLVEDIAAGKSVADSRKGQQT